MPEKLSIDERMKELDVAKGIGIILVVFAHVNYTPVLLTLIYSFHMPLFFVLSGMVFSKDRYPTFWAFLKRRWKTMILPYLLFSLLSIVYVFTSERLWDSATDLTREEYLEAFLQIFLAQGSKPVLNTPLWFVPCLLAVEILYFWISKLKLPVLVPVCAVLSVCGWLLESGMLPIDNTLLPWSLDSALFALSFYASGNFLFPYIKQCINAVKLHEKKTWICINWIIVCIAVWLPLTLINGKVSLGSKVLHHGVLFYLTGMLGTMGVLSVSILLEKFRFLGYLGRNTFCIMSVHYMIRKFMLPKYYGIFGIPKYSSKVLKETIVPFILVFLLSLLVTAGYDRIKKSLESLLKRA